MVSLEERLDQAERIIKTPAFRQNKGLGNEVGYYVFDYPAEKELAVRERIKYMKSKNSKALDGFELVVFDLYDIVIDILVQAGYMEQCMEFEKTKGLSRIIQAIGNLMQIDKKSGIIIRHIQENTPREAVIFLTGIGKCYPLMRSHHILNKLHQVINRVPVVLFYPGTYDGRELVLFSRIKDDNYYRAFRLID